MRLILVSLLVLPAFPQGDSAWTPEHSMRVQKVADVVPSPDGTMALWTQTRAIMEPEKSEQLTHIFLYRNGGVQQLTRGEKSTQSPVFAPGGKHVFFTSDRSGKKQIYRLPLDGGEAETLSDWKGALGAFAVSPDGKFIAFAAAEQDAEEEKARKEKRDVKVIDERPRNHSLWVIPVESDAAGKRVPRKIASGDFHAGEFRWAPDSRRIAFERRPTPEFNDGRRSDIAEVEIESGSVRTIAGTGATETQPRYSPDGRYFAFVQSAPNASTLDGARIALLDRASNTTRLLPASADERPQLMDWAGDSRHIYFSEPRRTRSAIYSMPLDGPPVLVHAPEKGVLRAGDTLSRDGLWAGVTVESAAVPVEAVLFHLPTGRPTQISQANTGLPRLPLGETSVITWKSRDGMEVEGLLTLPVAYRQGTRYPLALIIHGGPAGVFSESFIGAQGVQSVAAFAARGHAVLRVNPRGSVGYGNRFTRANLKDWGGGDYHDIMAGVDRLIAQGIADPDRMAVMGWSYGGYMTSWVISQTTRFKAAIIGAGITNLWSMWGTNDIPSVLDDYFAGSPWDQPELYRQRSGLFHARQVKTPTLFLHGEADLRVPIGQAYEYYHALKQLGVTTKMVAYPRTPHGPQEPKFQLDVMQRHIDWVEKYSR
ncbi:MAG: S9 family peptidase [Bryobacterales bacterium]|nr:S9 family peptidase [Bryobacterales bacterium]